MTAPQLTIPPDAAAQFIETAAVLGRDPQEWANEHIRFVAGELADAKTGELMQEAFLMGCPRAVERRLKAWSEARGVPLSRFRASIADYRANMKAGRNILDRVAKPAAPARKVS